MELNRQDMLKGAAVVATTGSLTVFADAGTASAATLSAAPMRSPAKPSLRMGAKGSQVLTLQRRLSSLGYWLGRVAGDFGDLTRQAVVTLWGAGGLRVGNSLLVY